MIYDSIDLVFDSDGDLAIEAGEIRDTSNDVLEAIMQAIRIRGTYPIYSWELYPDVGVPFQPIGSPNTREVGELWSESYYTTLVANGLVDPDDISVESVPLTATTILTLVELNVEPTVANGFQSHRVLIAQATVDSDHILYL